jgi:hypothetical protein
VEGRKEGVVAYFKVLFQHIHAGTVEKQANLSPNSQSLYKYSMQILAATKQET